MSDALEQTLRRTLEADPGNAGVRAALARLQRDREALAEATETIDGISDVSVLAAEDRALVAEIRLDAGAPEAALAAAAGDDAACRLARARALLALDRLSEGLTEYRAAVADNPALEDKALEARLGAEVVPVAPTGGEGRPRLRVIANDDTDEDDVARLLGAPEEPVRFADVGGLDAVKKEINRRIILPFQKPSLFQRFRQRVGGGILLYGPPGCGKTLLARATAGECRASFHNIAISDILDMYMGESERKLRAVFDKARQSTPSVLFFDEIEGLGGKRQHAREATAAKLVSQLLSEMDGFARDNQGVLILGATNTPWALDPALRRPGRFDRTLFVPPPDKDARRAILDILLRDVPAEGDLGLETLATKTSGFSGADLRNLVETATETAIERSIDAGREVPLDRAMLREALEEVGATTLEWLTTARNYARYANEGGQYDAVLEFLRKHGQ